jgi:hypothetical protein
MPSGVLFREEACLPASVLGPGERRALARLARISFDVGMLIQDEGCSPVGGVEKTGKGLRGKRKSPSGLAALRAADDEVKSANCRELVKSEKLER